MLSHDNLIFNCSATNLDLIVALPEDVSIPIYEHRVVSYLPLSHIAGFMVDAVTPILCGSSVYFAKPDAL